MDILALDFDGVICKSAGETCVAGWKAALRLWPGLFRGTVPAEIRDGFERVRPVMEVGFQSILLVRLLRDGCPVEKILADAPLLIFGLMRREGLATEKLVDLFGATRDHWMARDLAGWVDCHAFYDGAIEALNQSERPVYIITTKEKRFAVALCAAAGLLLPEENIFGLESGTKRKVLLRLSRRHQNARFHFLEDRLATLIQVESESDLDVRLYWAAWGYHTAQERIRAQNASQISVLALEQFAAFLRTPSKFAV